MLTFGEIQPNSIFSKVTWDIAKASYPFEQSGADVEDHAVFFFFTLVTGPRRSLSLDFSDTRVYEPKIRARLGTTAHSDHALVPIDLSTLNPNENRG